MEEEIDHLADWRASIPAETASCLPKRGRPKKGSRTPIDWDLGEKLFVEGELSGEAENTVRLYPSQSVIGKRIGVSKGSIDQRKRMYGWLEKRAEFQRLNGVSPSVGPDLVVDGANLSGRLIPRARARRSAEEILSAYIGLYDDAVQKKKVRFDTIADLERAVRLLAFVQGRAESIKQTHTTVSLEIMQGRHARLKAQVVAQVDDQVAGVLGQGSGVVDGEFEEVVEPDGWARAVELSKRCG